MFYAKYVVLTVMFFAAVALGLFDDNDDENEVVQTRKEALCNSAPRGGIGFLLYVRRPDYGWEKDTPRSIITLVVNKWMSASKEEIQQMELQLGVELSKALLRDISSPIHPNELALYVQALVSIGRNPRDFYGRDLVALLLDRVESMPAPHPYLVLVLCDARALLDKHLLAIRMHLMPRNSETKQQLEMKALAVKAFACAASLHRDFAKYRVDLQNAANSLITQQRADGSFGNLYATSLMVQALISSNTSTPWRQEAALEFIHRHSLTEQSLLGIYATELALKSAIYPFIKDIHPFAQQTNGSYGHEERIQKDWPRLHFTVRSELRPDVHVTITIRVPPNSNLFDVMKLSALEDPNFQFSYYLDDNHHPRVYAVGGVPNDAEENFYWQLCRQEHLRNPPLPVKSYLHTVHTSPALELADSNHHFILWYRNTPCEKDNI